MPVNPAARFQVDPVAYNPPGVCFVCRGNIGPFIRTGLRHDFFKEAPDASRDGDVYLCASCVRDMFNTLGQADDSQVKITTAAYQTGYQNGLRQGKRLLDDFNRTYFAHCNSDIGLVPDGFIDYLTANDSESAAREQSDSDEATKTVEQILGLDSSEGPDDIPSDRDDGLFGDLDE